MNWRSMFSTVLALALLQTAVSSDKRAKRAGGLLKATAKIIEHVLSPAVPAIPDLRKHGGAANTLATPGGSSTMPADWNTSATAPPPATSKPPTYYQI
ncbi:hypothetical protein [Streptomyces sp. NPDC005093]